MAKSKTSKRAQEKEQPIRQNVRLKAGDSVMIIAGGNSKGRVLKGKTGKLIKIVDSTRAIVEGLNIVTRHRRASGPNSPGGKVPMEAPLHLSNLMYYAEKLKKPVRLKIKSLADGKKVRGYIDPESKEFVQLER